MADNYSTEVWKAVPAFEGRYEVSTFGRVRSLMHRTRVRQTPKILRPEIRTGNPNRSYFRVAHSFRGKTWKLARLVLTVFVGPPTFPKAQAAHWDGDSMNNRLSNLRWATRLENEQDRKRHGRVLRGERNGYSKLTEGQARAIIEGKVQRVTHRELAARYGVSIALIGHVGKTTWRHLLTCPHDLAERDTMVADGYCPACLVAELAQVRAAAQGTARQLEEATKQLAWYQKRCAWYAGESDKGAALREATQALVNGWTNRASANSASGHGVAWSVYNQCAQELHDSLRAVLQGTP